MKKLIIVLLICCGGVLGYWMARQNQKLFELPIPQERLQNSKTHGTAVAGIVEIGMEMWQVQEILGPPLERHDFIQQNNVKQEMWTYKDRRLHFENGLLKREERG